MNHWFAAIIEGEVLEFKILFPDQVGLHTIRLKDGTVRENVDLNEGTFGMHWILVKEVEREKKPKEPCATHNWYFDFDGHGKVGKWYSCTDCQAQEWRHEEYGNELRRT